jgi:prepilin-type N-terminal cleavage/methylation domain-containing protein
VTKTHNEAGFSLLELMMAMALLLIVSSIATTALIQMTNSQMTIWNRTEMHSGIRGATELLQQEVGQAGRINLPGKVTLTGAVAAQPTCDPGTPLLNAVAVGVATTAATGNPTAGMWATAGPPASYIMLTTLDGDNQEFFRVGAVTATAISACFLKPHAIGTVIVPMGGFATGIIPDTGIANGSTASVLKMYGDVNGDGNMMYVEYTCDPMPPGVTTPTVAPPGTGNLYRNMMAYDAAVKPPTANAPILLSNLQTNPGGVPCFTYQTQPNPITIQGTSFTFILDVAVTLTVQTEQIDPLTRAYQTETKALLNVSPRNVFNAWQLATASYTDHIQSTPTSVTLLLP